MSDKPKPRWYQFSLKTLLMVITLLCLGPGGYVAYEQAKARKQKAAVEAIEKLGGKVEYAKKVPVRSATMRLILGNESFGNVDEINFNHATVSDAGLKQLKVLRGITCLYLADTQVTGSGLENLAGLTFLVLENTQTTDAGLLNLTGLTKLEVLHLSNTQVTDAGLVHLARLKGLRYLYLDGTQVTEAGTAELQRALPNCQIQRVRPTLEKENERLNEMLERMENS